MDLFSDARGPGIRVEFSIEENLIHKINLSLANIFEWEILSTLTLNKQLIKDIYAYMSSYAAKIPIPMQLPLFAYESSTFIKKIQNDLVNIPFGQTLSYKELAARNGHPLAYRAAGTACGCNPFAFLLPCHRVIAVNQTLRGFAFGLEIKRRLLEFEKL